ncbi:60 kda lysophospholipase [Anaeramoeba flamelloides]|uniref:asparaginase n=1 Tax=Anaeramoeba flamelloides TaxID=1746091 RepID=A0ABQ8X3W5_9EUKA|nr:60 kda lysophospholipase [Anaeramoeba flamelloides]
MSLKKLLLGLGFATTTGFLSYVYFKENNRETKRKEEEEKENENENENENEKEKEKKRERIRERIREKKKKKKKNRQKKRQKTKKKAKKEKKRKTITFSKTTEMYESPNRLPKSHSTGILSQGEIPFDKKVYIIYTGGTIGMIKKKGKPLTPDPDFFKTLQSLPFLKSRYVPSLNYDNTIEPVDSTNIGLKEWLIIANSIKEVYNEYDGFVILHGTDTLAFTASALSFLLENLSKPVVVTGSQIPLGGCRSDGLNNLISSVLVATYSKIPEVVVVFNNKILRGNRTTKRSSEDIDAFVSFQYPQIGTCGIKVAVNKSLVLDDNKKPLVVHQEMEKEVIVIKLFPSIENVIERIYSHPNLCGVIIECYGAGNAPTSEKFLSTIKKASKRGIITVIVSQCVTGNVDLSTYKTGNDLVKAGCVGVFDMTTETAFTKLMFLLAKYDDIDFIKKLMPISLRGECSDNLETSSEVFVVYN